MKGEIRTMSEKGMRLVAMIEQKENKEYEVINFLPDIKIKHQDENDKTQPNFIVDDSQKKDYIQIPYAKGINDLTVIVGENGVGKTRLVNDIFSLDEKKMFIFKNLEEVDPIYKGKHTYYNFHALNGSSQGNNDWKLLFEGVSLTERDYENELIPAEYWGGEEVFEQEEYTEWFTRKVYIIKLSNAVESASPWGMGLDLSTTKLLKDDNYDSVLLSDMDKQIKFLLNDSGNAKRLERLIGFSGKGLNLVFNDDVLKEGWERQSEVFASVDMAYLKELLDFNVKQFKMEEKIKFFFEDYFAEIYSDIKLKDYRDDKLDYSETLHHLDDMVIMNREAIKKFLEGEIKEAKIQNRDVNDYISDKIKSGAHDSVIKAAYKYQFTCYSPEVRFAEFKKIAGQENQDILEQFDASFNYSGNKKNAIFDLHNNFISRDLQIEFQEDEGYLINGAEAINQFHSLQMTIYRENTLAIDIREQYTRVFPIFRYLIQCFSLKWSGLSSGQLTFLNLFGRLHSLAEYLNDESILLLLDEVDLGLHPEWQRKWVSAALPILGEIFKDNHVQIIMTTHSPIMLSDIYQENVIFLGTDDNGERIVKENGELSATFGQNIHDLYRQSFFLESTRGQYATDKISTTISMLNTLLNSQEDTYVKKVLFTEWIRNKHPEETEVDIEKLYMDYRNNRLNEENEILLESLKEILSLKNIDQKRREIIDEEKQKFLDATQLPEEQLEQGLKKIIDSIGEDVLRKTLLDMYHSIKEFQPKNRVKDLLSRYKITKEELREYLDGDEKA